MSGGPIRTNGSSLVSDEFKSLPEDTERLRALRHGLDSEGVVEVRDFLSPEAHATLRDQILELERTATSSFASGNRKYAVKGEQLAPTVVGRLAGSQYVVDLVNRLLGGFDDAPPWTTDPIRGEGSSPGSTSCASPAT